MTLLNNRLLEFAITNKIISPNYFGKIKCNYPDYLFQSTFQCCLWTSGVCAQGFWLSRVDSIILMVWWQEGHPISSINLASSKSVSKPHVFTPSNRDLPHQILAWLFHCCPVLCFFDIIFLNFSIELWTGLPILYHDWWGNLDVKRHTTIQQYNKPTRVPARKPNLWRLHNNSQSNSKTMSHKQTKFTAVS